MTTYTTKEAATAMTAYMNAMLFGPPPSEEVKATDKWDYCVTNNAAAPDRYWRRGEGIRVHRKHVTIRVDEYEWIPDTEAIDQLKRLMAQWRQEGKRDAADLVETRLESDGEETTTSSIYEALGRCNTKTRHVRIPIGDVKFYRELPRGDGLAQVVGDETGDWKPRTNARIINLGTTPEL